MSIVRGITCLAAGVMALAIAMPPQARADEWNQKTVFTFSGPVEIPGQVLPPGTYVFKLLDSDSDRSIVQVFNKRESHLYGTFLAIPDYRLRPRGKTILTFEERAAGAPQAVKTWFYPGENFGHDFVYPKTKAMELAKANNQPVPSMPEEMSAQTTQPAENTNAAPVTAMKQAPLKAQQPSQQEAEVAEVFAPPAQSAAPAPAPTTANRERRLPATGTRLPLIGLLGLLSLGVAGSLRFASAKVTK